MKYLKSYPLFENNNLDTIINDLNDILLDINDTGGFNCDAKIIPQGIIVNFRREKPGFDFKDIEDVYWRVKSYLSSNDYLEVGDLQQDFKTRAEENKKIRGAGKTLLTYAIFRPGFMFATST